MSGKRGKDMDTFRKPQNEEVELENTEFKVQSMRND